MTHHAPLIIDIEGTALTAQDRQRLAHPLVGGLILFGRNWHSRQQLAALCGEVKALRADMLICVDHEGGRVQRFRSDGLTHLPPMRAFGQMWMGQGRAAARGIQNAPEKRATKPEDTSRSALLAQNAATAAGYVLGAELRACGVDFSFTPVLDLDWQAPATAGATAAGATTAGGFASSAGSATSPAREAKPTRAAVTTRAATTTSRSAVIGDRAFHADARVTTLLAKALMHGLLQAGMANCGKHFPGHGFVQADSHTHLPIDRRSLKAILADDAAPYAWLNTVLTGVMPAHVVYPKVDARPAGFSSRWLQDILRARLGFGGAIFSDDLSMAGARQIDGREVSHTQAAVAALAAGCDLVLLCNQSAGGGQPVDDLINGLAQAQIEGRWQPSPASEARRLALLPTTPAPAWDALMTQPAYMHALALLP